MLALTLTQPWASLVVLGEKRVETRSWAPPKGLSLPVRIAIHAAKGWKASDAEAFESEPFRVAFERHGVTQYKALPFGAVVGTAELAKVARIDAGLVAKLTAQELAFGGYETGRFAWALIRPQLLRRPIGLRGQLGLFELERTIAEDLARGATGEANRGALACRICGGELDGGHMGEECPNETQADEDARHARERAEVDAETFEERAGILEHDAGLSRSEAEKRAREMIDDLHG